MDELEDRIRHFAEEASALEGFQVVCDPWSPWAGVAAACTADLADEYPNQSRILFAPRAPLDQTDALMHELAATGALSGALSAARWMADCSLLVPLEPPAAPAPAQDLKLDYSRPFHAAAGAAAALDCCSLPWRAAPASSAAGEIACCVLVLCPGCNWGNCKPSSQLHLITSSHVANNQEHYFKVLPDCARKCRG